MGRSISITLVISELMLIFTHLPHRIAHTYLSFTRFTTTPHHHHTPTSFTFLPHASPTHTPRLLDGRSVPLLPGSDGSLMVDFTHTHTRSMCIITFCDVVARRRHLQPFCCLTFWIALLLAGALCDGRQHGMARIHLQVVSVWDGGGTQQWLQFWLCTPVLLYVTAILPVCLSLCQCCPLYIKHFPHCRWVFPICGASSVAPSDR